MIDSQRPPITVIMSCYNSGKYLHQAVDSIFNQWSYKNLQVICIDDGSTDNTREILHSYGNRLIVLEHPHRRNKGQHASYNLAIRQTQNEFIAFLDDDDIWYADKMELQMEVFRRHPDVDLVYSNGHKIGPSGEILWQFLPDGHRETNKPEELLLDSYIAPSCTIVRRKVVEKVGYFKTDILFGDHDFFLRVSEVGKLWYISKALFGYRLHEGQISKTRKAREDGFAVLNRACRRYPYPKRIIRKRKAVLHYRLAEWDFKRRRLSKAICHFLLAGCYDIKRAVKIARTVIKDLISR